MKTVRQETRWNALIHVATDIRVSKVELEKHCDCRKLLSRPPHRERSERGWATGSEGVDRFGLERHANWSGAMKAAPEIPETFITKWDEDVASSRMFRQN